MCVVSEYGYSVAAGVAALSLKMPAVYTVRITLVVFQQKTSKKWTHDLFLIITSNMTFSYRNIIQVYLLVSNW